MSYQNLLVEHADGLSTVTVNRPDKLNALNALTIQEMHDCFNELRHTDSVRVVIITGAGDKAFVAGADINELASLDATGAERLANRGQELTWKIENLGKPVIAAINGFALGGGCEVALACTFRYASANARIGLPETNLGLIPGYGGTQRLSRLVGRGCALELILSGNHITAVEAQSIGLVNKVLSQDELMPATVEIASLMAHKSAVTLRLALKAVNEGSNMPLDAGCRLEAALFGICGATHDAKEGCQAFLKKRKPNFQDR
jgi:enoyl-CoA hydratase